MAHRSLSRSRAFPLLLSVPLLASGLFAQADWKVLKPTQLPSRVADHVLVADVLGLILFGGAQSGGTKLDETWRFRGNTWTKLSPRIRPPKRFRHAGAYDRGRGKFVIFGGSTSLRGGHMADTWEFRGTTWTQIKPAKSPSARNDAAMVYDSRQRRILLFGGRDANGTSLNDTWTFDGKTWTQLKPMTSPPGRRDHALAFDSVRNRVVLYGGFFAGLSIRADTWEFDGVNWTQRKPKTSPGPLVGNTLTYDEVRQRTVLFSGWNGTVQPRETWEWDGTNWTKRQPLRTPTGRSGHSAAYDWVRGRTLLVGGWDVGFTNETWEYRTSQRAGYTAFGAGCRGSAGIPVLAGVPGKGPWVGDTLQVRVTKLPSGVPAAMFLGFSNKTWGAIPLPLKLDGVGLTGCSLLVSPDLLGVLVNQNGSATWSAPLPNNVAFAGARFHNQALVFDRRANAFGAVLSNGGTAVIGVR